MLERLCLVIEYVLKLPQLSMYHHPRHPHVDTTSRLLVHSTLNFLQL